MARPRGDALPEGTQYTDTGCEVAPKCLECPLPVCRYDRPGGARVITNRARDTEIVARYGAGASAQIISEELGVKKRTVYRILAAAGVTRRVH